MQELNCNQVLALLTFFIENRLNQKLMQSVEYHLNICQNCREKYLNLRKIFNNYQDIKNKITESDNAPELSYKDRQYTDFKENLSAYIDNELNDSENLRIRKISIANQIARQELATALSIRELLKESFQKTKDSLKSDLCYTTISNLYCKNSKSTSLNIIKFIPIALIIILGIFFLLSMNI